MIKNAHPGNLTPRPDSRRRPERPRANKKKVQEKKLSTRTFHSKAATISMDYKFMANIGHSLPTKQQQHKLLPTGMEKLGRRFLKLESSKKKKFYPKHDLPSPRARGSNLEQPSRLVATFFPLPRGVGCLVRNSVRKKNINR